MNSNYTKPVNLGNPDEYSILDFAQLVQKFVGMLDTLFPAINYKLLDICR